jgi:hypothetical protein
MRTLGMPVLVAVLALVFWDRFFVWPLKILVVLFHELSHGLAALVSGGSIERIEISFEQGGACYTRGGSLFLILNAGYLGSLVWGAALLVAGGRSRHDRLIVGLLGGLLIAVSLVYIRSLFGFLYGVAAGILLLLVAAKLAAIVSDLLLATIGAVSCLYAIWDIGSDVLFREIAGSDAYQLAAVTGIPSLVWGVLWIALAGGGTLLAILLVWTGAAGDRAGGTPVRKP